MSGFYGQSFLDRANYKELVRDCLDAMKVMGAKVAFLPLGGVEAGWQETPNFGQTFNKTAEGSRGYGCFGKSCNWH